MTQQSEGGPPPPPPGPAAVSSPPAKQSYASLLSSKPSTQPQSSQAPPIPPKPPSAALEKAAGPVEAGAFYGAPPAAPGSNESPKPPTQPKLPPKPAWGTFKPASQLNVGAVSQAGMDGLVVEGDSVAPPPSESQAHALPPAYDQLDELEERKKAAKATAARILAGNGVATSQFQTVLPGDSYDWQSSPPAEDILVPDADSSDIPPPEPATNTSTSYAAHSTAVAPYQPSDQFSSDLTHRLENLPPLAPATNYSYDRPPLSRTATPPPAPEDDFASWDVSAFDANMSRWRKKGWLLPRLMSVPDEMGIQGQVEYLWRGSQPWNFRVEDKVPEGKYGAWGVTVADDGTFLSPEMVEGLKRSLADSAPAGGVENEGAPSDAPLNPSPSLGGIETVSLEEVKAARPHKDLYFNPVTRSWVLFASIAARSDAPIHMSPSPYETFRPCPASAPRVNALNLPKPFQPATVSEQAPEIEWDPSAEGRQDLSVWEGTKGHDALVSTSTFYPLIINEQLWLELEKECEPAPGETAIVAFHKAVHLIWRVLDGLLFAGSNKSLPVHGKTFRKSLDWSAVTHAIFVDTLGFRFRTDGDLLQPPKIGKHDEAERVTRARLVRAWLELGLILEAARREDITTLPKNAQDKKATRLSLVPPGYGFKQALGGDTLPLAAQSVDWTTVGSAAASASSLPVAVEQYDLLGATHNVSDAVIIKLYADQSHFDRDNTPAYFGALIKIGQARSSSEIEYEVAMERSRGRRTLEEINAAYAELGAGADWTEEALFEAYSNGREQADNNQRKDQLLDAFKLLAEVRDSEFLKQVIQSMDESLQQPQMTLAQAYTLFDLPEDAEEGMIEMMYPITLGDQPHEKDKLVKAMGMIADARNSSLLRNLVAQSTGTAAGAGENNNSNDESMALVPFSEPGPPPREDGKPVGLTNIANTCYLNSLLQFLFNVKELREAVLAFVPAEKGEQEERGEQRVGGRLVTEQEVERSNRFVSLLQELFQALVDSQTASVTPATELAYLALVTSSNKPYEAPTAAGPEDMPALQSTSAEQPMRTNSPVPIETILAQHQPAESDDPEAIAAEIAAMRELMSGNSVPSKRRLSQTNPPGEKDAESMQIDAVPLANSAPVSSPGGGLSNQVEAIRMDEGEDTQMEVASTPTLRSHSPTPTAATPAESEPAHMDVDGDSARRKRSKSIDGTPTQPTVVHSVPEEGAMSASAAVDSNAFETNSDVPPLLEEVGPVVQGPPLPPRPVGPVRGELDLEREVSNAMAFGLQNDVTEAQDNIMFQIETSQSKHALGSDLVKSMFFGKQKQTLQFDDPSVVPDPLRTTTVPFLSLGVRVPLVPEGGGARKEEMDLYAGLDKTFEDQQVTSEGFSAQLKVTLLEAPPMLQIQLQRVDYDREAKKVVKSNAHVAYPQQLALDRYLEVDPEDEEAVERQRLTREKRAEIEVARKALAELGRESEHSAHEKMVDFREWLEREPVREMAEGLVTDELLAKVDERAEQLKTEAAELEATIARLKGEIELIWADQEKAKFELVAVFIHRGTANSGHYYVYLLNKAENRWYKYNDATVTAVVREEVFRDTGGDSNAYFLGYEAVREGEGQPQGVAEAEAGEAEEVRMEEVVEGEAQVPEMNENEGVTNGVVEEQAEAPIDWEAERKLAEAFEKNGGVHEGW